MNVTTLDQQLIVELFEEQPQPAFWMTPVWDEANQIIDFEYTYCNQEFYRYMGLPKEKVLGSRLFDSPVVSDVDLRLKLFDQLHDVYRNGTRMQDKFYNSNVNKYYSYTRNRVKGGVLTVLQDRTEEYAIMQQLEEQTNFTNSILKNSSGGITVTEVIRNEHGGVIDGKIILANEAAEKLLHITKSDYENKSIAEVEPSILTNPIYQMALETLHNGVPFRTQYFFEPIGKWIELSVSKMDENHLINLLTDITETKEAQFQFQQAAERHQAVFKASQSGMFTFAPEFNEGGEVIDFRFVITNPSFAAYVGQTPEVLQGALGSTWFPGYLTNGVFDMYKQTYLTGVTLRKDIHYFVDQHDLYLDLLSTKIGNEVLVTFTDYTKLKKAQLQLEKLVEDLKRSNANLEEFAHAASHDMKEPIRKVLTFSDRLKNSLEPRMTEAEKNLFSRMENATQRMGILVDDLLAFSHLSERPKEMEVVDLNKKLENVLGDLELLIDEKGATIDIGPLPVVKGHRRQLQQLFQNLIGNALKYSKPNIDPVITITCEEVLGKDSPIHKLVESDDRSFYWIQVRDNGIGFEQQYAERIFAMFQRLHGKSEYAGTGVGLSIARKVVENHNGYIWAQSEPGAGATFHVLLPV